MMLCCILTKKRLFEDHPVSGECPGQTFSVCRQTHHDMTCYLAESYYQLEDYEEAEAIYDKPHRI